MATVEESYAYAESLTRAQRTTFYHTFRFLTPPRRRAIYAVYAFSRRLDDAVDSVDEKAVTAEEARRDLAFLTSFLDKNPPDDPLVPGLRDTIERFSIPRRYFDELIEGMAMDLDVRRYATFADLYAYCYRAASAVGLVCVEIFEYEGDGVEEPAEALGIAMQLTNILRDIAEDSRRGRIYLPLEDLDRFGYGEDELTRGVLNDRFRDMMRFQVGRARHYFELSDPLFPLVVPESRYCPELLRRFYSTILDQIERQDFDVFTERPSLPPYRKLAILGRTWWEARRAGKG
jgi:phytoene synthase